MSIYYIISGLLNALTNFAIFFLIIFYKKTTRINILFAIFSLNIALWSSGYFLWQLSNTYQQALFWTTVLNSCAAFIPTTFFHFIASISEEKKYRRSLIFICYLTSTIFLISAILGIYVDRVEPALFFKFWPKPGPIYIYYVVYYFTVVSYSLIMLYKKAYVSNESERQSLLLLFWGTLIGYIGGATNFFLFYDIPIPPIGNIFVTIYILILAYAIFRYQFLEIQIVIKKGLIYTTTITAISICYLLLVFGAESILQNLFNYESLTARISIAFGLGLAFMPFRHLVQILLERTIFQGSTVEIAEQNILLRREIADKEKFKAVATLASGMAHEVKNPLTAIKTFCEFLPQKKDDSEFLNNFSRIVGQEVNRIDNIVDQLLNFAKPIPPAFKKIELNSLIQETINLLNNTFISHMIDIEFEKTINIEVNADANQLKQVFLNLSLNAIDAMPNGGTLHITTKSDKNAVQIIFQDTGIGISKEDQKYIFDPFFTKKDGGTGLGLAICYGIIIEHGGKITLNSEIGRATTFKIILPL